MKRFLTVDWDFFIDASAEDRELMFPGGNENIPTSLDEYIWDSHYSYHDIARIGVVSKYLSFVRKLFKSNSFLSSQGKAFVSESHASAYGIISSLVSADEEFEVYNIDFHHDLYDYSKDLNCGNWANYLLKEFPNMSYCWVPREDSCTRFSNRYSPFTTILSFNAFIIQANEFCNKFDAIHLCRSSPWSPPHLDEKFLKLASSLNFEGIPPIIDDNVVTKRNFEVSSTDFSEIRTLSGFAHHLHKSGILKSKNSMI